MAQLLAQAHASPQAHCGPHAQRASVSAAFWQPQVQPAPGQGLQRQRLSCASFMTVSWLEMWDSTDATVRTPRR